jgi:PASTA domain
VSAPRTARKASSAARRLLLALCVVGALTAGASSGVDAAPTRVAVNAATYPDAVGDSGAAPDIQSIQVENDDEGQIVIQVRLFVTRVPPAAAETDFVAVFIDSDQNPATGSATGSEWAFAASGPQPATGVGEALLCRMAPEIDCPMDQGSFRATYNPDAVTFIIDRGDIGVDEGFNFWVGTSAPRQDDPDASDDDFAPDTGAQFAYDVVISPPCVVPNVRGRTLASARIALGRANCAVGRITRRASTTVPKGRVISTAPRAGARLASRARVSLVVSSGRAG